VIATDGDIEIAKCDVCGTQRTAIGEEAAKKLAAHLATFWTTYAGKDLCQGCSAVGKAHTQIPHPGHTGPRAKTVE
jgi:hypothetical protein